MQNWQDLINEEAPQPYGAVIADWYKRTGGASECDMLYLLAFALAGKLTIEHFKQEEKAA